MMQHRHNKIAEWSSKSCKAGLCVVKCSVYVTGEFRGTEIMLLLV